MAWTVLTHSTNQMTQRTYAGHPKLPIRCRHARMPNAGTTGEPGHLKSCGTCRTGSQKKEAVMAAQQTATKGVRGKVRGE